MSNSGDDDLVFLDEGTEEPEEEYLEGGYHRVAVGEKCLGDLYLPLKKLGWGHFSTVWKCTDRKGSEYAVKVVKSAKEYDEAAKEEIRLLKDLQPESDEEKGANNVIELLDFYKVEGTNGIHRCLVFPVYATSLLEIIRAHGHLGTPMGFNRVVTRQTALALDFIHSRGLIHADLKPENIMLEEVPEGFFDREEPYDRETEVYPPEKLRVRVIDLGNAIRSGELLEDVVQTRQYRAPEVILWHPAMGKSMDSWSLGCILFELLTGDILFDPRGGETYSQNEDHLALITELLGPIPKEILRKGEWSTKYYTKGYRRFQKIKKLKYWPLDRVLVEKYSLNNETIQGPLEVFSQLLEVDPEKRSLPGAIASHPWVEA